uniref:ATP synthase F0 subunit 6 n=1 Tax=Ophioleila elegans TaxID=1815333 RepID=UPI0023F37C7B|nr:ATP synthase F0 subunit 6 [Ophioleila elegans]WED07067.1 ATP synthase F0 subunit 6 [Ophioleila elegans]
MTLINPNNIFDQFLPANILFLSLTLIGGILALSWTLTINNSHWTPTRATTPKSLLSLIFNNLLNNNNNTWPNWIFPIFLICLSYNLLSLFPYTFSQTSHLSITFSISLPIWLALQIMGIINNWKAKISHLVPEGTPALLTPLMVLIELISLCIQPLTLGFRLGANLLAGHLLIFLCSCVVWEAIISSNIGILSFILLLSLFILEIAVACIQAAVFTILSKTYMEDNN